MRIHTIIHASFESPGVIETWALNKGHDFSSTHTYKGEILPEISSFDFLVILGGPQSPLEMDKYPYLRDEINLAKKAIEEKKAVLGVCLGAQIIGESLGAKTERSPNREIGVYPIHLSKEGKEDPLFKKFPSSFDVMHWHNDMPGISKDAVVLAASDGCPRQVVRYRDRVYGLQCHMELTSDLIEGMLRHCPGDLKPGKYVQDKATLVKNEMSDINKKMMRILDYLETV